LRGTVTDLVSEPSGRRTHHLSFVSYAVEKKVSKHPETFGKGAIAGVAGPESANNAATGGNLISLLALEFPLMLYWQCSIPLSSSTESNPAPFHKG